MAGASSPRSALMKKIRCASSDKVVCAQKALARVNLAD